MVDVVSDQTEISYAESVTGWSGDTFSLETEILVQNANSVACTQTGNGVNDVIYTGGSWDMSGSTVRCYMNSIITPDMAVTDAIQIFLGDGTNTAFYTVVGSGSDYAGGWQDYFFNADTTPTSGTVNTTVVTSVGIRINTASKPRNSPANAWYDNWRFGNGLEINSDTTEAINFTDVSVEDNLVANKYDIVKLTDGVLFGKGKLTLGNAAAAKNCNLVSLNETIFFVDADVSTSLYGIVGTEGTGATDIDITGLVCKTVGTTGAELDFSAAVTSFSVEGCTFLDMGAMTFNTGTVTSTKFNGCGTTSIAAAQTFTGNTWVGSGQIDLNNGGTLVDCIIDSSATSPAVLTNDLGDMTGCTFISAGTGHAVNLGTIAASATQTWDNSDSGYAATDGSTGNETLLVNYTDTGADLTINVAAGASTPTVYNTGAGTVNVVAGQVTFKVIVRDIEDQTLLQNARVYVTAAAGGSLSVGTVIIDKVLTDVAGEAEDTRSYSTNQPITGVVRLASSGIYYKTSPIAGTVDNVSGLTLTIQLIPDD